MNHTVRSTLQTDGPQYARLVNLQQAFAQVCNALSPLVQQTRVWNRVALHHMAYKGLRERFPALGSQMVCNAIYSVSRASREVYQSPGSPFNLQRLGDRPLPLLQFADTCPVYFDRHTLSLRQGQASMYTLDGRMKFQLELSPADEEAFHTRKLREIVLQRQGEKFELCFQFGEAVPEGDPVAAPALTEPPSIKPSKAAVKPAMRPTANAANGVPSYLKVEETT